jgi:hypothetical protein
MTDCQPRYDESVSLNLFRTRQQFFQAFYGPSGTIHASIKLLREPSRLATLTLEETECMFEIIMSHRRGLKADNMATAISAVTYLIWGLQINKTPSDCELDSFSVLQLFHS